MPIWLPRVVLKILREKATTEFYEKKGKIVSVSFCTWAVFAFLFLFFLTGIELCNNPGPQPEPKALDAHGNRCIDRRGSCT